MVTRTFLSKSNTVILNSEYNFGLNPTADLFYGSVYSRFIFQFDLSNIQSLINDKTYPDPNKLIHKLHFINCASVGLNGQTDRNNIVYANYPSEKQRTSSFELMLFQLPQDFDGGSGYDYPSDGFSTGTKNISTTGSNWYQATTAIPWNNSPGIYTTQDLAIQYDNYQNGLNSNIISTFPFDLGNENLEIDLTNSVNNILLNNLNNYGYCLCFSPQYEILSTDILQYVGFFTQNTPTFYEPFLETIYTDYISDNRNNFHLDTINKLYFYSNGALNDGITCTILNEDGITPILYPSVTQAAKNAYFVEVSLSSQNYDSNRMLYDQWGNISYSGSTSGTSTSVTLEFVTKDSIYNAIGYDNLDPYDLVPTIYGINNGEKITQNEEIRKLIIDARVPFTSNQSELIDGAEYRLYVKKGQDELTVIDYQPINKALNHNYFTLSINSLIVNKYYLDIKIITNSQIRIYKNILEFEIVNNY